MTTYAELEKEHNEIHETLRDLKKRMFDILTKANVRVTDITLTRATVIVYCSNEKHAQKAASFLNNSGQWTVKVYHSEKGWNVGGVINS